MASEWDEFPIVQSGGNLAPPADRPDQVDPFAEFPIVPNQSQPAVSPPTEELKAAPTLLDSLQSGNYGEAARIAKEDIGHWLAMGEPDVAQKVHGAGETSLLGTQEQLPPVAADPNVPFSEYGNAARAIVNVGNRTMAGLTSSPMMLAALPVGGASAGIGRAVAGGFAADMASGIPDAWKAVQAAELTPAGSQERWEAGLNMVSLGLMTHAALGHFVGGGKANAEASSSKPEVRVSETPPDSSALVETQQSSPVESVASPQVGTVDSIPQSQASPSEPIPATEGVQQTSRLTAEAPTPQGEAAPSGPLGSPERAGYGSREFTQEPPAPEIDFAKGDTPEQRTENFLNPDGKPPDAVRFEKGEDVPEELSHLPKTQNRDGSTTVYDPEFAPESAAKPAAIESDEARQARREHEASLQSDYEQHQASGGDELLDAVDKGGGLPAKVSPRDQYAGELKIVRETYRTPDRAERIRYEKIFKKGAPDIDALTQHLRESGFDVETPSDTLNLIQDRIRTGKPIYGSEARGTALAGEGMKLRQRAGEAGYTDLIPDAIDFGRRVYQKGMDFAKWSAEMVRHLGEKIKEHLKTIWDHVTATAGSESGAVGARGGLNLKGERVDTKAAREGKFTPFKEVLNKWVGNRQVATLRGLKIGEDVRKSLPNTKDRAAVNVFREAGGNVDTIRQQLATPNLPKWFKKAAERAVNLPDNAKAVATRLDAWYKRSGQRAQMTGLVEHLRNNYVNHAWKDDAAAKKAFGGAGKLNTSFRPSKERVVPTLFDGAKLGLRPKSMDAAELASIYAHSADRALSDRGFVKDLVNTKLSNGQPLALSQQEAGALAMEARKQGQPSPFSDYKPVRHWAFKGEDYRGDILVHPSHASHVRAAIETSTLDRPEFAATPAGAFARKAFSKVLSGQSWIKQNMLSIPAFHYVQEGTEGLGHHINPLGVERVDPANPLHRDAMQHGLMVAGTHGGESQWIEGLQTNRALINKIPGLGPKLKASSSYLFERYIPSLKIKTYAAALGRNLKRMAKDIESGRVTVDDVKYQTAKQVNDAYGHLNYADLGRSENIQKLTRAILLAPDFLEARARQALSGAAGFIPGKLARMNGEQRMAFLTLSLGQYVFARALNYYLDDKKLHLDFKDLFAVYHNGRRYTMRSVPGDVLEAMTETRKFLQNRLSPLVRAEDEFRTGLNYRGQKVSTGQAVKDVATMPIPLGLKNVAAVIPGLHDVGERETSWGSQAAQNIGVKVNRASPVIDAHRIAHDWMRNQPNYKEDTGTYPSSPYRQLQNALEDKNKEGALRAYRELLKTKSKDKIQDGMELSASHPFTKSQDGDALMMKQLSGDDLATVKEAVQRRKDVLRSFNDLRRDARAHVIEQDSLRKRGMLESLLY